MVVCSSGDSLHLELQTKALASAVAENAERKAMNFFKPPHRDRVLGLLLGGWVLSIILTIVVHWRVLRYFSILFLIVAIVFFMLSILYTLMGAAEEKPKPVQPLRKPKQPKS